MFGWPCFLYAPADVQAEFEREWDEAWDMTGSHTNRFYVFCRWVEKAYGENTPMSRKGLRFALDRITKKFTRKLEGQRHGNPTEDECEQDSRGDDRALHLHHLHR